MGCRQVEHIAAAAVAHLERVKHVPNRHVPVHLLLSPSLRPGHRFATDQCVVLMECAHGAWKRECPCACMNDSCCCAAQCSCSHHAHNTLNLLWLPPGCSRCNILHSSLNPRNSAQPAQSGSFGGSKRSYCHLPALIQATCTCFRSVPFPP